MEVVVRKMLKRGKMDRDVVEIVGIDSLVPKEHLLRKIDKAVDFSRLYEMVERYTVKTMAVRVSIQWCCSKWC